MEYLGAAYAGFQRQPDKVTVQQVLERAIEAVTGEPTRVTGAGRTDAGAHACHQVVAFDTASALETWVLNRAINAHLPLDVAIRDLEESPADFHPRYDAAARRYRYLVWNRPERSPFWHGRAAHIPVHLDETAMNHAAALLVGSHDFSSFVPVRHEGDRHRSVSGAQCSRNGHLIAFEIEASGFMRQMVRAIAGTLIRVGLGKLSAAEFRAILERRSRHEAGDTAPAHGLYLMDVIYPHSGIVDHAYRSGAPSRHIEE